MESIITGLGAFGFGAVIGWFAYFTNRYRKGEVQFSDLTTLLGVIGGAAVTRLFGDASAVLFGAYGLGLAVGFFAYFVTLVILVRKSEGTYNLTWFLDGRRKKVDESWEIPSETRPTVAPMDPRPMAALRAPKPTPLAVAGAERDRAISALTVAMRELTDRAGATADGAERKRLDEKHGELGRKQEELLAARLRDILESLEVQAALGRLTAITGDLEAEARLMKDTADAVAQAAKVIDRATKVVGFLGGLFP
jgi:hypothetical protein